MRNRFAGVCYRCGKRVEPNQGHFEAGGFKKIEKLGETVRGKKWILQHADCAIKYRGTKQIHGGKKELIDDFEEIK